MLINSCLIWASNTNRPIIWFGRVSHHTLTLNGRCKLLADSLLTTDVSWKCFLIPSTLNRVLSQMEFQFSPGSRYRKHYVQYRYMSIVPHTIVCETWRRLKIIDLLSPGRNFTNGKNFTYFAISRRTGLCWRRNNTMK
jgi:hypothetical protein